MDAIHSGTAFVFRLEIRNLPGTLGQIISRISQHGGHIQAVDLVESTETTVIRDVTVIANDTLRPALIAAIELNSEANVLYVSDTILLAHLGGKIETGLKAPLKTREDLSTFYTPGVARVCSYIQEDPARAFSFTIKRNTVAVVTDGTAVLGLGDIGPEASLPVMEGKAMLFKEFGGVDAFPIALASKNVDEIVATVRAIAPVFGGINLGAPLFRDRRAAQTRARHPGLPR